MEVASVINSPGLWLSSSLMVIVILAQSALFLKEAFKEAENVGLTREQCMRGMRSAIITAIGPSFSPVIILIGLLAVLGAPTAWMRMNDIGAGRTELAMANAAANVIGAQLKAGKVTLEGFAAALWGMALNNLGWMLVALFTTHRMARAVDYLNAKYDRGWIKLMMAGAAIGLFAYLLSNQVVGKPSQQVMAALTSAGAMLLLSNVAKKYRGLQEPALGIAMLAGMFLAAALS